MNVAEHGKTVRVHYIGTLDTGRIFDSTEGGDPYEFTIGNGQVFPALEQAVIGMAAGEVKNILVPAEEAFGGWRKENILTLERGRFPRDRELRVGQKLSIGFAGGQALVMMVVDAGEDMVTLDGNHPLAGHDLTFALKLEGVK